jgi:hypothetical protein
MRFMGAMRFAGSIMGVGRAPWVVDRWSDDFKYRRRDVRDAFWAMVGVIWVVATINWWLPYVKGWWLMGLALLALILGGVIWHGALRQKQAVVYYREFRTRYTTSSQHLPTGREDFIHFANPWWWCWWQAQWLLAQGWTAMVDAIVMLRVTTPDPAWCRRDKREFRAVLEERAEQYWAAHDARVHRVEDIFDFMFRLWWMRVALQGLLWGSPAYIYLVYVGLHQQILWMAGVGLGVPMSLWSLYAVMSNQASERRRELAHPTNNGA